MDDVRLLIADNENKIRMIVKEAIVVEGYFVDEAADGIAALKLFKRNEYNLVILDTSIPELDCYNVCRQIRKVSDVPIIIIGLQNEEEEKLSYFNLGVDDYVVKPFSIAELLARIKVLLHRTSGL